MAVTNRKGAERQGDAPSFIETDGDLARNDRENGADSSADGMHHNILAASWQFLLVCSLVTLMVRSWSMRAHRVGIAGAREQ